MPLRVIPFAKGNFYHIYNRGVAKQDIFLTTADKQRFTHLLSKYSKKFKISVIAYCLIPNHFHLLLRQDSNYSIAEFMRFLSHKIIQNECLKARES